MNITHEYQKAVQCLLKINQSIQINGAMSQKDFREILEECGYTALAKENEELR